jgi:hypothetical protein
VIQDGEVSLIDAVVDCPDATAESEEIDSVFKIKRNNENTICRGVGEDDASSSPVISFENISTSTFNKIVANVSIVSIDSTISIISFPNFAKKKKDSTYSASHSQHHHRISISLMTGKDHLCCDKHKEHH